MYCARDDSNPNAALMESAAPGTAAFGYTTLDWDRE
jgi:hypothetical protein